MDVKDSSNLDSHNTVVLRPEGSVAESNMSTMKLSTDPPARLNSFYNQPMAHSLTRLGSKRSE